MAENKEKKKGNKTIKTILMSILVPIMIIVLIAGIFFAVVDAMIGIITGVVTSIANIIKHPWQAVQETIGTISNAWDKFWNNNNFDPDQYIKGVITEPRVFIPLDQFNEMVENLDKSINRNTAGLDDITIKKMLLVYYRSIYLSNTSIYIEIADGEEKKIEEPFKWKWEKETDNSDKKRYLYINGAITLKNQDDKEIPVYTEDVLNSIYNEYLKVKDDKEEYAEAIKEYLTKCCVLEGTNVKIHSFDTATTTTEYYYDGKFMGAKKESSTSNHNTVTLNYTNEVSQYTTPVEFMTNLMTISGSQDFINEFMKMAIQTGEIEIKIYETSNNVKTETTEEYIQKAEAIGQDKNAGIQYTAAIEVMGQDKKMNLVEVQSEEEQIDGEEKINLKVKNTSGRVATVFVLKDGKKINMGYGTYKQKVMQKDEEYVFTNLYKSSNKEKIKTDTKSVKKVTIETTKENRYDIGVSSVKNWYLKSEQKNSEITKETYYTKNDAGEQVLIDSKDNVYITKEPARKMEEYIDSNNPNIFTMVNMINWPISEQNATGSKGNEIIEKYGREGFLNIIFNYTIKKEEDNYHYNNYQFNKMNISYESEVSKSVWVTETLTTLEVGIAPTTEENLEGFLALLSNTTGKPRTGEAFKPKNDGGKPIEYDDVYGGKSKVGDLLENGLEILCQILDTAYTDEKICNTEGLSTIMRYVMYLYSGNDYGVTSLDFSIFGIGSFKTVGHGNGGIEEILKSYENEALRQYMNGESTNYSSVSKYVTQDKSQYKLHYSAYDGCLNFSYGIMVRNSKGTLNNTAFFAEEGINLQALINQYNSGQEVLVDVDKLDRIFKKIVQEKKSVIKDCLERKGVSLKSYEIDALVNVAYQYGNCGQYISGEQNIANLYKNYYMTGQKDLFKAKAVAETERGLSTFFVGSDYATRKKYNWILFSEGRYILSNGKEISGSMGSEVAEFALQFVGENHSRFTGYNPSNGVADVWFGADWCAMFVSYCYNECKLIPNTLPIPYAGCSSILTTLENNGNSRLRIVGTRGPWNFSQRVNYVPSPGDIIFFNYGNGNKSDHTGIVVSCDGTKVYTVEGNSGSSSTSPYWRGSKVMQHEYAINDARIVAYISINDN